MFFGRMCCRDMKNVVVVEDGIKLWGNKVAAFVSSDISFERCIGDSFEGGNTASGIKYGKR